jgi:hypothetical protein
VYVQTAAAFGVGKGTESAETHAAEAGVRYVRARRLLQKQPRVRVLWSEELTHVTCAPSTSRYAGCEALSY